MTWLAELQQSSGISPKQRPPLRSGPRARHAGSDSDASELASFTPSFLWLLRDFYLRLEEDGRQVRGGASELCGKRSGGGLPASVSSLLQH